VADSELKFDGLDGKLLISMPGIGDPRFERAVIYMCAHSDEGAMGIIVNKPAEDISFSQLLAKLNVMPGDETIQLPQGADDMPVHVGGPVETGRGFVLHTADYFAEDSTLPVDDQMGLTATLTILRSIVDGSGPRLALLALGYAGWGPGQLEREIQDNGWLHCDADEALIFDLDDTAKYDQALTKIGIDPAALSSIAGHA